jgi:hypothetical protein
MEEDAPLRPAQLSTAVVVSVVARVVSVVEVERFVEEQGTVEVKASVEVREASAVVNGEVEAAVIAEAIAAGVVAAMGTALVDGIRGITAGIEAAASADAGEAIDTSAGREIAGEASVVQGQVHGAGFVITLLTLLPVLRSQRILPSRLLLRHRLLRRRLSR